MGRDEGEGGRGQDRRFRCEHALAAAGLLVLALAVYDTFADRFSMVGRSVVAALSSPAVTTR
ncbi:hypothetical protein [Caldovatus aquaticus]|uniref:Uncharacterized protein n=1 Tax=Caldovatus aquaticus TaxID=2865671 RepID=A0ABS7F8I6_9PROT|nr:hypothetical protein [Caldovatus aquaticus]MBW8271252.1 hypothetical protein [Caldovatus aquaticus]